MMTFAAYRRYLDEQRVCADTHSLTHTPTMIMIPIRIAFIEGSWI